MTIKFNEVKKVMARWFSPIQMLELDACSKCQECVKVCPTVNASFPDSAMEKIHFWQKFTKAPSLISSIFGNDSEANLEKISLSLSRCTSCGICTVVCESGIQTASLWESMRGSSRDLGFKEDIATKKSEMIIKKKNPYGEEHENRNSWIPSEYVINDKAPIAIFTGCTMAFRNPELGRAALRILDASDIHFCILGEDEFCCGSFLFRTGTWNEYTDTIMDMIEIIIGKEITEILVPCAGCLKTLTLDWPIVYGKPLPFRVTSFAAFIREKLRKKEIKFESGDDRSVIYHDPCHGARHLMHHLGEDMVFEAPREVISSIPNIKLTEFPQNRQFQSCCGAGGGLKSEDPQMASSIARKKLVSAKKIGAEVIVSTCPFCERNFSDAKDEGCSLEVMDLIELVDRAITGKKP